MTIGVQCGQNCETATQSEISMEAAPKNGMKLMRPPMPINSPWLKPTSLSAVA